jgi:hypothetical protein
MKALFESRTPPNFGPSTNVDGYAIYQNRSAEIGWMIVRLLPFLQPSAGAFGDGWENQRKVLDEAFRYLVEGLTTSLNKRIGSSFAEMMDKKFKFKQPFHFFESTYKYP